MSIVRNGYEINSLFNYYTESWNFVSIFLVLSVLENLWFFLLELYLFLDTLRWVVKSLNVNI